MKRLIKRYVLKAQTDSENDEVNEGKPNIPNTVDKYISMVLRCYEVFLSAWFCLLYVGPTR